MIRRMERKDSKECAHLHYCSIENSFLSEFGSFFLERLYEGLVKSRNCTGYVYIENSEVLGFIVGSRNMDKFLRNLILRKFFVLAPFVFFRLLTKPYLVKNVFETFFYSGKSTIGNVKAELVSIAVKEDRIGKGIGTTLFNELVNSFRKGNIYEFKVIVGKDIVNANKFYKALGFDFVFTFNMYGKDINLYTYSL